MITSNINAYTYEQYNAIWCKVVSLEEISKDVQTDQDIINECIEEIYMRYTPESWDDVFQWREDTWQLSQGEHLNIVEEIIKGDIFYRQEEKKEQIEWRDQVLLYIGFEGGIEAYKKASREAQEQVITAIKTNWYSPVNQDDLLQAPDFTEYAQLKNDFLNGIFSENRRFYFNRTATQAQKAIQEEDRDNVPAVIGIDDQKFAVMWFNF